MEIKHYKSINTLTSVVLGAFTCADITDYIFFAKKVFNGSVPVIIAQGFYVAGLIAVVLLLFTALENIKKRGVFLNRNEKLFRYFGIAVLVLGITSDVLYKNITDIETSAPRVLALLGGTLIFVSFIFKIGIKIQEEQDLTI